MKYINEGNDAKAKLSAGGGDAPKNAKNMINRVMSEKETARRTKRASKIGAKRRREENKTVRQI